MSMDNDDTKAMVRPRLQGFTVSESWRCVIRCKYLGPTNYKGTRVKVSRWDGSAWGADPNRMTVAWDHALSAIGNYAAAVDLYLERAGWDGDWTVASCDGGAVAVYVPNSASR